MRSNRLMVAAAVAVAVATVILLGMRAAGADAIRVFVNGNQIGFDQPPIERAGRVFVPLRGVFERLGASVVYDNGLINASGDGHNIQLHIGQTAALVDGQTRYLDVAPFIVGQRTLVPLRFISESLGAGVQWDESSQSVQISMSGAPPPPAGVQLLSLRPAANASVNSSRPTVSGRFSVPVDPNSVRILLDGRDVSSAAYVSPNDFLFTPSYALGAQQHTVEVSGRSQSGVSFDRSWAFTSGSTSTTNFLNNLRPANGSTVGSDFTVSGTTLPNASVRIAATASQIFGGIFRAVTGTYTTDVQADGNGNFSHDVPLATTSGGSVTVQITSTAQNTNEGATATLNLHS